MRKAIRRGQKRFVSFLLVFVVAFVSVMSVLPVGVPVEAANKTAEDIRAEQAVLDQKIKEAEAKIKNTQQQLNAEKDKQASIQQQISNVETQLALYLTKIDTVNLAIEQKQLEIDTKEAEIESNEALFAERVHKMYMTNNSSSLLSTLLSAESFSDFLNRTEILKRVSEADNELIHTLREQKDDLKTMKTDLEAEKAEYISTKEEIVQKEKNLSDLYSQSKGQETALKQAEKKYMEDKAKYDSQNKALEAELAQILASQSSETAYGDGALIWPVPGRSYISSPFGWRYLFGQRDYHTGIDIPAPVGTNIVASDAGKVLWVKKVSYGYGWHLLIDHGNGYATLYAHASRIDVSQGQTVVKGQTVAGVGTTGNSTGYHLHFEVRVNNVQKNPQNYVVYR